MRKTNSKEMHSDKLTAKRHMQKDHKRKQNDHRWPENHKEMQNYKKRNKKIANKR